MSVNSNVTKHDFDAKSADWALGPGSISWRIMRDPVVFLVGQIRTATLLLLHPPFAASAEHDTFTVDPVLRFRRVGMYAYSVTYGTTIDAERLSNMVRSRHNQIVGIEPITRRPYQSHSEYELALTHVIQASSYLVIYEAIRGQLTIAERDQYFLEQRVPSAMIGINPDHLPITYDEAQKFLSSAREHFAVGTRGRELLSAYDNSPYPPGTALGDLPFFKRHMALLGTRIIADMAISTLPEEDRLILAINRRPKLRWQRFVRGSLKLFSSFMRSTRGHKLWVEYLQKRAAAVFLRALEYEDAPDYEARRSTFQVPDAHAFYHELPDLKRNWPGSVADYALGREIEGELSSQPRAVVNLRDPRKELAAGNL